VGVPTLQFIYNMLLRKKKMKTDVLVLNRCMIPLHIITWKRAMSLLVQDKCQALGADFMHHDCSSWIEATKSVNKDVHKFVNTASFCIAVPHIVVLTAYDRLPKSQVKYTRETLFQRDKFKCAYCGNRFPRKQLTQVNKVQRKTLAELRVENQRRNKVAREEARLNNQNLGAYERLTLKIKKANPTT